MKIKVKHEMKIVLIIMVLIMTMIVTFVGTAKNMGFHNDFVMNWLKY